MRKDLKKIISDIGVQETQKLLENFINDDEFIFDFKDGDRAYLYVNFMGWFNKNMDLSVEACIAGFIQYNLWMK
jgi:hypothetical protein